MSGDDQAFDALRRANPVPLIDAGARPDPVPVDVLRRIVAGGVRPAFPRRRARAAAALALGLVAVGTAGWTLVGPRDEPSKPLTVGCYAVADLGGRVEVAVQDGRPPEDICADLWRKGVLGEGVVPPLAACVLASGTVGVFPGTGPGVCVAVQGTPARPAVTAEPDPVALRLALVETLHAEGCVGVERAVHLVRRALDDGGFRGWTVEVAGTPRPDRPCATLGFDVPAARVIVVPGPRVP